MMYNACKCGKMKARKAKVCRICWDKQYAQRNKRKIMDRDEGLKPYQKHGIVKSYSEIKAKGNKQWNNIYKDNNFIWG